MLAQSFVISAAHTDDDLDADRRGGGRGPGRLRPSHRGPDDRGLAARATGRAGAARVRRAPSARSVTTLDVVRPGRWSSGPALHERMRELYPICRSITGDGVRETLRLIGRDIPLEVKTVPSGTEVFDWTVNDEWNVRDAYIADARRPAAGRLPGAQPPPGRATASRSRARMSLDELRPHLHSLPDHPDWIPYRTSYYARTWGFCLTQAQLEALGPGPFEVVVDSTIGPGELELRRARRSRRAQRGGDRQRPCLPSLAGQRQPERHRDRHRAGQDAAGGRASALHLPVPVRPGHDRLDHLAEPASRTSGRGSGTGWC